MYILYIYIPPDWVGGWGCGPLPAARGKGKISYGGSIWKHAKTKA